MSKVLQNCFSLSEIRTLERELTYTSLHTSTQGFRQKKIYGGGTIRKHKFAKKRGFVF